VLLGCDCDVGRGEARERKRIREAIERDSPSPDHRCPVWIRADLRGENGLTDCVGTRNCPFLVEATLAELSALKVDVWYSTGLFLLVPLLKQSMVAE
jgi:hypothetical protein